jgi:hypothetical protein
VQKNADVRKLPFKKSLQSISCAEEGSGTEGEERGSNQAQTGYYMTATFVGVIIVLIIIFDI